MVDVIEFGDCRDIMQRWIELGVKVHTCVTSPPYFGLRDYKCEGQIGLEQTPDEYIAALVDVFRNVRELLVDDARCGSILATLMPEPVEPTENPPSNAIVGNTRNTLKHMSDRTRNASAIGLKHKDLIGIPWLLAFALRADGWYLRQDIIWNKPNPMPESVRDRCTKAHEYIFLLSKSEKYYFDYEAVQEQAVRGEYTETVEVSGLFRPDHIKARTLPPFQKS